MNYCLKRKEILRKRESFSYMKEESFLVRGSYFFLFFKPSLEPNETFNKIGFLVTKKQIKLAVHRNRAKRLMREAYRLLKNKIKVGYYFLLIANRKILTCSVLDVKKQLQEALAKNSLLI